MKSLLLDISSGRINLPADVRRIFMSSTSGRASGAITVTPEMAKIFLLYNVSNRPPKHESILVWTREMKERRWRYNGQTIVFDEHGNLLNGQNRLMACVQAGVPFETLIVCGVPRNAFDTMDTGVRYSIADSLRLKGEKAVPVLGAVIKLLWSYKKGDMSWGRKGPTNHEALELLTEYPLIRASSEFGNANRGPLLQSVSAFLHFIGSQLDKSMAESFLLSVLRGENISYGEPAYAYRSQLLGINKHTGTRPNQKTICALGIKALSAHFTGQTIKVLKIGTSEPFPVFQIDGVEVPVFGKAPASSSFFTAGN